MIVEDCLVTTLKGLGYPVSKLVHEGGETTFFVYQLLLKKPTSFADDEKTDERYSYMVHLFSKENYKTLLSDTESALIAAGFDVSSIGAETYEKEKKLYHMPMAVKYEKEVEE